MNYPLFTSESVCAGHPDKVCDQISDAVVDAALSQDKFSRVAVETLVTTDQIILAGEVTTSAALDYAAIARSVVKDLGYTEPAWGFSNRSRVTALVHEQSGEIAQGVDSGGAGDQGMMFGYATSETPSLMPLPILLSHQLAEGIDDAREQKTIPYLRPDGKTEVTIRYENGLPQTIERLVIAVPHHEDVTTREVKNDLYEYVISPLLAKYQLSYPKEAVILNGTGVWHIGGPAADTGVTGRKIIVDGYGGMGRVGGGAFSGKDPTKVDRSGAYAARFIAKSIVASGLAKRAEVQIAYVIGQKEPICTSLETFGTQTASAKVITDYAFSLLDLSVGGIIEGLELRQPIYRSSARYGHFGREEFPWEQTRSGLPKAGSSDIKTVLSV